MVEITERQFQRQVTELARKLGWRVYSIPDSRKSTESGYPDLTVWHPTHHLMFFAELKAEKGRLSSDQILVLDELRQSGQTVYVWRPSDWTQVEKVLNERKRK